MSAIQTVQDHLKGPSLRPVPVRVTGAARELARRQEVAVRLGHDVQLSPYLEVLLNITDARRGAA